MSSSNPIPFLDRRWNQCAWPLWEGSPQIHERMVCGDPTTVLHSKGGDRPCSYCAYHARIAFDYKPERRRAA